MSRVYVYAWVQCCFHSFPSLSLVSEGAYSIDGQLHGDKRVPLQWHNQIWQSLEERQSAGKPCSECARSHWAWGKVNWSVGQVTAKS